MLLLKTFSLTSSAFPTGNQTCCCSRVFILAVIHLFCTRTRAPPQRLRIPENEYIYIYKFYIYIYICSGAELTVLEYSVRTPKPFTVFEHQSAWGIKFLGKEWIFINDDPLYDTLWKPKCRLLGLEALVVSRGRVSTQLGMWPRSLSQKQPLTAKVKFI